MARMASAAAFSMAVALVALLATAAHGQGLGLRERDLLNITSLKCTFTTSMRVTWKDGVPQPTRETASLTIAIDAISAADGSALIGSGADAEDVNVQVYGWNMHFLEPSRGGRIAVTTVFAQYTTGTKFKAVHTRSELAPTGAGEPQAIQYYGDCDVMR